MKLNKWTVALAAMGVVSLGAVAQAEEQPSSVMTALSATTISGYVDTSAQWNIGKGNDNLPPYRFNSPSKADGFNLDVVQIRIEKPLDEAEWAAGYRVDLWAGPDANVLATQSSLSASDFALRQAYVALRAPLFNGLDFKVGVFDSIIGYESVASPDNPNYTRSYGHTLEPTTHTGILASYRFSELISASAGIADTFGPIINDRAQFGSSGLTYGPFAPLWNRVLGGVALSGFQNAQSETAKTYMGSVSLTAPESMGFLAGSTLDAGIVHGYNSSVLGSGIGVNQNSYYIGATVATPVTGLRVGAAFDYLDTGAVQGTATDFNNVTHSVVVDSDENYSIAGYLSFQATEKLSLHGRVEYLKAGLDANIDGINFEPTRMRILATTITAQYDLWKNVISRVELRWDHSLNSADLFGTTDSFGSPTDRNAWLLAGNIIYRF